MPKKITLSTGEEITERRKNNNKATYVVTWGAILLLATSIGWLITAKSQSEMRMTKIEDTNSEIRSQLSSIQESISWIKDALKEMKRR